MADDAQAAAAAKSDAYICKQEHYCKVLDCLMPENTEKAAVQIALAAVDQKKQLKDVAQYVKQEMDKRFPASGKATEGVYHCVVGKSFASAISHEARQFIRLKIDTYHIVLWKSKDSPFHPAAA